MKVTRRMVEWGVWAALVQAALVLGIEVREPENDYDIPPPASSSAALTATEPTDNGMAVGEAPEIEPTASNIAQEVEISSELYEPSVTPAIVDAVFPENHKNFSGSPYLGTIESPPYLNTYNKYQQQYKEYYAQKNQHAASAKPIKFEETTESHYVAPNGLSAYADEAPSESDVRFRSKPYPYRYEGSHTSEHYEQTAYPIPEEHNELESQEEEPKKHLPTASPLFPPFSGFGSSLSSLFGGGRKLAAPSSHQHHFHKDDHHGERFEVSHKHKSSQSWKKLLKVLTTVVPFGLFLATLTPNLLYINSTEEKKPSRVRSMDSPDHADRRQDGVVDPLVELLQRFGGLEAMEDPQCEDRFFCEMSVLGKNEGSSFVEKGFWYLASETPDHLAQQVGMKELFNAIRSNSCQVFDCKQSSQKKQEMEDKMPSEAVDDNKLHKKHKTVKKYIKGS